MEFLKFLNENSGAIGVIFSGLVTIATLLYATLTWKLVNETKRMRRAQTDAKITVRADTRKEAISLIDFVVANEGVGPAYDITFVVNPLNPEKCDESITNKINSLGFINKGIEYLSPNQEIRTFLASMLKNFEKKIDTAVEIGVSYKTSSGEQIKDTYLLDMSIFKGMQQLGKPDLYSIAKSIENMQKDIHKLSTGFTKLKVITQTKAENIKEEQENYDRAESFFKEQEKRDKNIENKT